MSTTGMRMKQQERSDVPLFFRHDTEDFAKLPHHGSSGTRIPPMPEEIFNWHWHWLKRQEQAAGPKRNGPITATDIPEIYRRYTNDACSEAPHG